MPRSPLRMWNVYIYTDIQLQSGTWLLNNSDFRDNYKWHYSAFINVLHWTILLITKKSLLEMPLSMTILPIFLSSFFRNSVYHYPCSEKILCHVCINFADVDQINFFSLSNLCTDVQYRLQAFINSHSQKNKSLACIHKQ